MSAPNDQSASSSPTSEHRSVSPSPRRASAASTTPLRELKDAEDRLQEAKRAAAAAAAHVLELEKQASDVRQRVNAARALALCVIRIRTRAPCPVRALIGTRINASSC